MPVATNALQFRVVMRPRHVVTVLAAVIVAGTSLFVGLADHEERLPQLYYSLDKSKPWNDIARNLDPRISDGEYDEMRTRYFYEVVAPKLTDKSETFAACREFMHLTERPWQWDRRPSRGEPPRVIQLAFWVSAAYLVVAFSFWAWRRVLKPAGQIARDEGLMGLAQVVLHGRRSRATRPGA